MIFFFFPIALSAVQSMDHSFDGISIKTEEGAYQRKSIIVEISDKSSSSLGKESKMKQIALSF